MDEREQRIVDKLLLTGAMQVAGVDEKTGEFLYQFTPLLKEIMPDLYDEHLKHVNSELMNLWQKGFVDMDLMSENPIVTLSEKSYDEKEISKLSKEERWSIEEVKRLLSSK